MRSLFEERFEYLGKDRGYPTPGGFSEAGRGFEIAKHPDLFVDQVVIAVKHGRRALVMKPTTTRSGQHQRPDLLIPENRKASRWEFSGRGFPQSY